VAFAGAASYLVSRRAIPKIQELLLRRLSNRPRTNADIVLRDLAHAGVLKLGCLFPFVTSIRLEHVIGTTAIGRHDEISELACNIARQSFFVDCDREKCREYAAKFLTIPADDSQLQLLTSVLGFTLTDKYRSF
jgi:hypothetical protein